MKLPWTVTSRPRTAIALALAVATFGLLAIPSPALAAPEEIQVYLDDATAPGKFGLDVHNNVALSGIRDAEYPGARPANHVYRLTPEFYYGIAPGLELGAYLLTARDADGGVHVDGAKMRLKYIAPHDEKQGSFWGVNLEVGLGRGLTSASDPWVLKAIVGLHF